MTLEELSVLQSGNSERCIFSTPRVPSTWKEEQHGSRCSQNESDAGYNRTVKPSRLHPTTPVWNVVQVKRNPELRPWCLRCQINREIEPTLREYSLRDFSGTPDVWIFNSPTQYGRVDALGYYLHSELKKHLKLKVCLLRRAELALRRSAIRDRWKYP